MGCGTAEATGLSFVCFVISCVVSQQSFFVCFFLPILHPPPSRLMMISTFTPIFFIEISFVLRVVSLQN